MSFLAKLRYVEGQSLENQFKQLNKRKLTPTDANKKAKSKKYEATRPERRFNTFLVSRGQKDRPWLNYNKAKNVMTCILSIKLMYDEKDDNGYCERFLYDVNWKLVEEYAREE